MTETPEKSPSNPPERPDHHEGDEGADRVRDTIALPSHVASSGTLDRLVETARGFARQAASENTLKAYAKDWAHFARWCRMRGADPLPSSPQLIGLYIADLAAPSGKTPALSVSSIGVVCGRGRNPTLRLWPAIFSGEIDVFPSERRNMGQEIGR